MGVYRPHITCGNEVHAAVSSLHCVHLEGSTQGHRPSRLQAESLALTFLLLNLETSFGDKRLMTWPKHGKSEGNVGVCLY